MAKALVQFSVSFHTGQVGAQQLPHAGVTSQAATRPRACFKASVPSNNLHLVSCARSSRQIIRAGNGQGCQLASSFIGVSPELYRCIANRHASRLEGIRPTDKNRHLHPIKQAAIKAEGEFGSDNFNKLEVVGNDSKNPQSVIEDQFNRFAKAIMSQDEKLAEQVIEEMGYFGDPVLQDQFERFKKVLTENDDEGVEQVINELGYSGDEALEEQFNRFAKDALSDDDETDEQEIGDSRDLTLEDQFNRFAKAMELNDDGMAEEVLKEMGHSVDIDEMKSLVTEVNNMQEQLQELSDEVMKLVAEGDADSALGLIEANLELIAEQLEAGYKGMEQIAMLDTLASLQLSMGEFQEAERILGQIKDLMEDVGIDSLQPLADRILEHMGSMYTELGKPDEGLPFYLKSLEIQEDLVGADSPLIVDSLVGLASTYCDLDENASAIELYNRIVSIIEKTRGPVDETLALPLSKLGQCLLEEGKTDEAEIVLLRALKLVEKTYGVKDGRFGVAKCALARAYATSGSVDEAISLYHEGIQIMEGCTKLDDDDSSLETARADLAELLNLVGRNDEAEELWETNLLSKERLFGPDHPCLIVHLQNLATAYAVADKHDKSVPVLRRSLKLAVDDLGPDAPQVSVPLEMLATALHHLNREQEAEPVARRALEIREAHFDPESAVIGEACNCLASILHSSGKFEEALSLMKRVLVVQESELGADSPQLVLSLELIIMLLDKLGRPEEIEPYYARLALLSTSGDGDEEEGGEEDDDVGVDDGENDDGFDFRESGGRGKLDSRPAPASNMFDDATDSDVIDI